MPYIFSLLTLALITVLSLMPAQEFPQVDVQFADKWTHWVMYGFLTMVMGIETFRHWRRHTKKGTPVGCPLRLRFFYIALFSAVWGGLMELGQAYLTTTRHGDWWDVVANAFGALCALIVLLLLSTRTTGGGTR